MTISLNNTSTQTCFICFEDYKEGEIENTDKIIELACHHFFHADCIKEWFTTRETNEYSLTCPSDNRILIPKKEELNLSVEGLEAHFSKIEKDPHQVSKEKVILALQKLRPHSDVIFALLIGMLSNSTDTNKGEEEFRSWIINNVPEDLRSISVYILSQYFLQGAGIRTLRSEVRQLSLMNSNAWSKEIPDEGVYVDDYTKDGKEIRMKVSKEYLIRATKNYLYKKEHNIPDFSRILDYGKFQESLHFIIGLNKHDSEVQLCKDLDFQNLQKDLSTLITQQASLPTEKILSSINEMIKRREMSDIAKETLPLIIQEILFDRGALRTLRQEVNRWKKEPMEQWPSKIKDEGIFYLDENNSVRYCKIEDFQEQVKSQLRNDTISSIAKFVFIGATATFFIKKMINTKLYE